MKRTISILLAMVMILSLCACSGTRSTPTGGGSSEKAQAQTDSAEEKQEAAEPAAEATEPAEESAEPAAEAAEPAAESAEPAAEAAVTPAGAKGDYTDTYKSFGMTVHYPEQFANTKGTFYPRGGSELDTGIVAMAYFYVAMPKDKYNTLMTEEDSSEEDAKDLYNRTQEILYVFSVDKGRGASAVISAFPQHDLKEEQFTEIGKIDDVTYYIFDSPELLYLWATWCGNCVNELTELAEMNRRLADKNVAVIGICTDANTRPDECKALIAEHEVDYLNLMPIDDLDEILEIPGLPTSYFIDSEGKIMCAPFIGAPHEMSAYEKVIDSLLEGEEAAVERGTPAAANNEGVYRVIVTDSDGDFVPGVRVQFCSDSMCRMGKTDENGVAVFNAEEGTIYTVHVMKFPEGYVPNAEEYKTTETYCDVCIVLQKQ